MDNSLVPNRFLNARMKKKSTFMGLTIDIFKLSVAQARSIQALTSEFDEKNTPTEEQSLDILVHVVKLGAPELETIEDFTVYPIEEMAELANNIMIFSGLRDPEKADKPVKS